MSWTENDLKNLKAKGYKVDDSKSGEIAIIKKKKIEKVSIEKNTIELFLKQFQQQGLIKSYETEYKFDEVRKFRFDWCIPELRLAIEYEGIVSEKSGHTTITGYSNNCVKYNLAVTQGWNILRYTALNYLELYSDLEKIFKTTKKNFYCQNENNENCKEQCITCFSKDC